MLLPHHEPHGHVVNWKTFCKMAKPVGICQAKRPMLTTLSVMCAVRAASLPRVMAGTSEAARPHVTVIAAPAYRCGPGKSLPAVRTHRLVALQTVQTNSQGSAKKLIISSEHTLSHRNNVHVTACADCGRGLLAAMSDWHSKIMCGGVIPCTGSGHNVALERTLNHTSQDEQLQMCHGCRGKADKHACAK